MPILKIKAGKRILKIKDCRGLSSVRGLMFDSLIDKNGALIHGNNIWMPFCKPLDLYFLDENFVVIEKQVAAPLTLNPKTWKSYSNRDAKYCLEVKKDRASIKKGQKVFFVPASCQRS